MPIITLEGKQIPYIVYRSKRSRYVRLTVTMGGGVRVSAPPRIPDRELPKFLHEKSSWVLDKLREFQRLERSIPRLRFRSGAELPFLGKMYTLRVLPSENGDSRVRISGNLLDVFIPSSCPAGEREHFVRDIVSAWHRVQALRVIPDRVRIYARAMRLTPGRITIRRQKSRWGSCSTDGNLSFNQRLMMAPPRIIDYVIVHELAHLAELNHSPRFWRIVERFCPDRDTYQKWLKDHIYYLDC